VAAEEMGGEKRTEGTAPLHKLYHKNHPNGDHTHAHAKTQKLGMP
jgi:hypothetical protein